MEAAHNLAILAASGRMWSFRGRDYRVSKLTPRAGGELQRVIMEVHPDPRKLAREMMEGLPSEVQKHIWDKASEDAKSWPPDIDSPQGIRVILSPKGMATLFFLALKAGIAGFTPEQAAELADEASMEEASELFALMLPEDKSPKAQTAPERTESTKA